MLATLMLGAAMAAEAPPPQDPLAQAPPRLALQVTTLGFAYTAAGLITVGAYANQWNRSNTMYEWGLVGLALGTLGGLAAFPAVMLATRRETASSGAPFNSQLRYLALAGATLGYSAYILGSISGRFGVGLDRDRGSILLATTLMFPIAAHLQIVENQNWVQEVGVLPMAGGEPGLSMVAVF